MSRKMFFIIGILVVLILPVVGVGLAATPTTWETVLVPSGFDIYYAEMLEEFNGYLYAAIGGVPGLQVWRSADGSSWEPVTDYGLTDGPYTWLAVWDMVVFDDHLYIAAADYFNEGNPSAIFRTADGLAWEKVVDDGFPGTYSPNIWKFGVFKGMLYASAPTYTGTNPIWRSATGDYGSWEKVAEIPNMDAFASMVAYKGALYGISDSSADENGTLPTQVWRTYDGVAWKPVVLDGFGNLLNNSGGDFEVYQGYLYVGVGDNTSTSDGGEMYRTQDGIRWERVAAAGLGNQNNYKFDGLIAYLGNLYAYSVNNVDGCEVFRSQDGLDWVKVNESGWGVPANFATHLGVGQAVFKDDLYIGTFNFDGTGFIVRLVHP